MGGTGATGSGGSMGSGGAATGTGGTGANSGAAGAHVSLDASGKYTVIVRASRVDLQPGRSAQPAAADHDRGRLGCRRLVP